MRSALEKSKFTDWFFRILTNDRDILGWGDVVARTPVWLIGTTVEVFLDYLLSP
ncbi:MAG: hypothetical protein WCC46_08415 [Terriglobales bacterium]